MKSAVSPHKLLFFFQNLSPSLLFTFSFPRSNFHQFRFSESFIKYDSEFKILTLTGSPPSGEIGKKSEIL